MSQLDCWVPADIWCLRCRLSPADARHQHHGVGRKHSRRSIGKWFQS